ncbi:MAG: hypothetical protein WD871_02595 [Xanthobacteraceae bacterium]
MRSAHTTIFERINKTLHAQYADIVAEPLPERWIDLIRYLNEKERKDSKLLNRKLSETGRQEPKRPAGREL